MMPAQEAIAQELIDCPVSEQWETPLSKVQPYTGLTKVAPYTAEGVENIFFLVDSP
jgi:hypothetical protein